MPSLPIKECTGCSACAMLCPVGAIVMAEDAEEFLRPFVELEKCIHCVKCERHCHTKQMRNAERTPAYGVFAAKNCSEDIHRKSQSGGAFYALASDVIARGGAVYGAAMDKKLETRHIRVTELAQLSQLQGVKYIQSRLGDVFTQVGADLKNNTAVLFSGTPCQIAGLYGYLQGKDVSTEKLLTCDLVCYGVPSPGVFREWIKCLEKAQGARVTQMCYRRTDEKWGKGKEYYRFANGEVLEGGYFTQLYFRNLILRDSCTDCYYCNMDRVGDITLGDFWGIEKTMPEFYDDRGVSLIMCSTEKGKLALERAKEQLILQESNSQAAMAAQPRLQGIAVKHSTNRESFWKNYRQRGMLYIAIEEGFIPPTLGYRIQKKLETIKQKLGK